MATDAQRVIGAGVTLTILGEERRLLFDLGGLEVVEEAFDGLLNFQEALNKGYRGRRLKALRTGLLAAGQHAGETPKRVDALLSRLVGSPDFVKEIDLGIAAITEAFNQAIPPVTKASSKDSARGKGSHGRASTGEPSSSATSPPQSSAA